MRVAILGMGPSADAYARHAAGAGDVRQVFDETWTVNAFGSVFRADRLFHMDDVRIQEIRSEGGNAQIGHLLDYLQRAPGPVYTSRTLPNEPNPLLESTQAALDKLSGAGALLPSGVSERAYLEGALRWLKAERALQQRGGFAGLVEYPLEAVLNATGGPPYFTSTVPYAIAFALAGRAAGLPEDVTELALFGIDYSHVNAIKAEVGRACCEFWLGRCIQQGIGLKLPPDTWLLGTSSRQKNLYGYDTQAVSVGWNADNSCTISTKLKPAPTAEEVERAYSHHPDPEKVAA